MHRIAEGIEDGRNFMVDAGVMPPDICHRQRDQFGKRAGPIHAHALRICTEMTPACETIAAAPADQMPFTADDIAGEKVVHV